MSESFHDVVVIGAGISGLYAAQLLRGRFPDVLIVEAQDRVGGRIKQVEGLAPWAVQLGPEFVHGSKSVLVNLLTDFGFNFTEKQWPNFWYFAEEQQALGKLVADEDVDEEIDRMYEMFEDAATLPHPPPGIDISALDWMRQGGATDRMVAAADVCYANDYCCSIDQLGVREMIEENRQFACADQPYLIMDGALGGFVDRLSKGLNIRTACPVECVQYTTQQRHGWDSSSGTQPEVVLHCANGDKIRCRRVLVTVPLKVLQDKVINFEPSLPDFKQVAIDRVRMGNAVKIIMLFNDRFWPEDMYDVLCTSSLVPEFWMLRYPPTEAGKDCPQHCIVGFLAGRRADAVSAMPEEVAVNLFLEQLDAVFKDKSEFGPTPATSTYAKSMVVDWSKEQWVRGAYTYPTLGAELGDREALAAPVNGCVFFAGEATNTNLNPCMQGAMETSQRAAAQIISSLSPTTRSPMAHL